MVPEVVLGEHGLLGFEDFDRSLLVGLGGLEHPLDGQDIVETELRETIPHLLRVRRPAVPTGDVLHEVDALALDGVGQNHGRLALNVTCLLERGQDLLHVVPVDVNDVPVERAVLVRQGLDVHHVLDPPVDLKAIPVDDRTEVVQLEVASLHDGFPDLPLLLLPVPHQAVDAVVPVVQTCGQSDANADGQSLPERPGRSLDPRQLLPVRMPLERRVKLAERHDLLDVIVSGGAQAEVERRRLVAGGPDDPVAVLPVGVLRVVVGHVQIERGRDIHYRQCPAGVARARCVQRDQVVAAHQVGGLLEVVRRVPLADLARLGVENRHPWSSRSHRAVRRPWCW